MIYFEPGSCSVCDYPISQAKVHYPVYNGRFFERDIKYRYKDMKNDEEIDKCPECDGTLPDGIEHEKRKLMLTEDHFC